MGSECSTLVLVLNRAWGSVVVKALRYWSDGPGIDPRWCHLRFFSWFLPTKPCALRSTQPLKMSKGGRYVWLTTYHPRNAERQENPGPSYPEPLGPPRPVAGYLYLLCISFKYRYNKQVSCPDIPDYPLAGAQVYSNQPIWRVLLHLMLLVTGYDPYVMSGHNIT